jgi:hypothetical protein
MRRGLVVVVLLMSILAGSVSAGPAESAPPVSIKVSRPLSIPEKLFVFSGEDVGSETPYQDEVRLVDPDGEVQAACAPTEASTSTTLVEGEFGCEHPWCCRLWGQHTCYASPGLWRVWGIGVRNCSGEPIPGWSPYWMGCVPVDQDSDGCDGQCYWCQAWSYHCGGSWCSN